MLWSSTVDPRVLGWEVSGLKWRRWQTVANRQLVTRSTRLTRLVTQLSRHKRAHNKATSGNFYSAACRSDSTLKQCSTWMAYLTASEHTTRHTQYRAVRFDYLGLMCAVSKWPTTASLNGRNVRSKSTINSLVSDIAIFVLKRDVKL